MLEELRRKAIDLVRDHEWESLLSLEEQLRGDSQLWVNIWAPSCALAARNLGLTIANHHAGYGTGHVVSEAWIDDFGKWVVLDGQNGFYWVDPAGLPLGVLELQELYRAGARPGVECLRRPFSDGELGVWWSHFHSAYVNGAAWPQGSVTPYFEGGPGRLPVLVADARQAYPDLHELGIAFVISEGRQAIQPVAAHPFAVGFRVTDSESQMDLALTERWVFPASPPGEYQMDIAVRTDYGTLKPFTMRWTVS